MTSSGEDPETGKTAAQKQQAARKAEALAAALRANLQRRKARERALRAQDSPSTPQGKEPKWTK